MGFYEHLTTFADQPVVEWDPDHPDLGGTAYRVSLDYDASSQGTHWSDRFATLLDSPAAGRLVALVVGAWFEMFDANGEAEAVVEAIVAARDRLPQLRAIFFGDIISEECEVSWIQNTDLSPLFGAFPVLEHFAARGGNNLTLGAIRHDRLRSLVVQTGGMNRSIVAEIVAAQLPALEHLELWLGTEDYGGNVAVADLAPLLDGTRFARLTYLGLRNSAIADEIAEAVARAPILERIRVLDLSLGTLSDTGAAALLASPAVATLEKLDVHHHYCTPAIVARLEALGITVDAGEAEAPDEYNGAVYRYVAVSE